MTTFSLQIADGIAHIVLDRPEAHNSMTMDFWRELPLAVRDIDRSAKARVIVITASGKHFTSGMDLSVCPGFAGGGESPRARRRWWRGCARRG